MTRRRTWVANGDKGDQCPDLCVRRVREGGRIRKGSREEESCVCASAPFPCCSFCLDHTCQTLKQLASHPSHPAWRSPSLPERAPLAHPHGITLFTAHPSSQWFLLICLMAFISVYCSSSSLGCELRDDQDPPEPCTCLGLGS